MNRDLEIRVAQLRNQADALGQAVADLARDAYALGRSDGLAEGIEIGLADLDDPALRRPVAV